MESLTKTLRKDYMDKIKENWKRIQGSIGFIGFVLALGIIATVIFFVGRFSAPEINLVDGKVMRETIETEFKNGKESERNRDTWYWPPAELINSNVDLKDMESLMEKIEK